MKMRLLFLMLFAITVLTSCSEDDEAPIPKDTTNAMFYFSASIPPAKVPTKTVNITRYIMEVYKADDPSTVIKRVEQAGTTLVVPLAGNTNYICLFWADEVAPNDNIEGTFNALDLKNVIFNTSKTMTDAFFARLDITDSKTNFDVTLKRATAQVNIVTTGTVEANTNLKITYNEYNSFNTFSSDVKGTAVETSKTFNSIATIGTLGTFLTFASVTGILTDFTALYNSAITNKKNNVPLKANYVTNIRGDYTAGDQSFALIITVDEVWESVIPGVQINVATGINPKWIIVADRNAEKGGTHGATADREATDYGYYYAWSNETNDAINVDKAYRACFDFGEGNGFWRLPTQVEWTIISGNSGAPHTVNDNRKLKMETDNTTTPATTTWKLYDERVGQSGFVYFPMSGYKASFGASALADAGNIGHYWTSTPNGTNYAGRLSFKKIDGHSVIASDIARTTGFSVRCVRDI